MEACVGPTNRDEQSRLVSHQNNLPRSSTASFTMRAGNSDDTIFIN
jgi:hypothetical protein